MTTIIWKRFVTVCKQLKLFIVKSCLNSLIDMSVNFNRRHMNLPIFSVNIGIIKHLLSLNIRSVILDLLRFSTYDNNVKQALHFSFELYVFRVT